MPVRKFTYSPMPRSLPALTKYDAAMHLRTTSQSMPTELSGMRNCAITSASWARISRTFFSALIFK